VAILDADKEGFLRSTTSLIQTMGRAARHINGRALLFADTVTGSMRAAIEETNRRRAAQQRYNDEHGIVPQSVIKPLDPELLKIYEGDYYEVPKVAETETRFASLEDLEREMVALGEEMREAARRFEFERAAALRDQVKRLKKLELEWMAGSAPEGAAP
jgi:excinuclease ABC subunit B